MSSWSEAQHPRDDRGRFEDAGTVRGNRRVVAAPSAAPAPHVSSVAPAEPAEASGGWWDGDEAPAGDFWAEPEPADRHARTEGEFTRMQAQMRDWRSRGIHVPPAEPDTSPLGRALGTDTQEGADNFARLKAYREAGYDGPLDQDGNIPDPDDPANNESLHGLAAMR